MVNVAGGEVKGAQGPPPNDGTLLRGCGRRPSSDIDRQMGQARVVDFGGVKTLPWRRVENGQRSRAFACRTRSSECCRCRYRLTAGKDDNETGRPWTQCMHVQRNRVGVYRNPAHPSQLQKRNRSSRDRRRATGPGVVRSAGAAWSNVRRHNGRCRFRDHSKSLFGFVARHVPRSDSRVPSRLCRGLFARLDRSAGDKGQQQHGDGSRDTCNDLHTSSPSLNRSDRKWSNRRSLRHDRRLDCLGVSSREIS